MNMVINITKVKKNERWVIYSNNIEATKIPSDWYLWMHHTVNETPNINNVKYNWQKNMRKILQELKKAYKPNKITKKIKKKK